MLNYFVVATFLTLLTHGYFALRLLPAIAQPRKWRLVAAVLLGNCLLLPGTLVFTLSADPRTAGWSVPLARVAFADGGFCILLTAGLALRDLGWGLGWLLWRGWAGRQSPDSVQRSQRRQLLLGGLNLAVGSAAGAASVVGYGIAMAPPQVHKVRVPCPRAPQSWGARGLRIVQISDLHVGPTIRRDYVEQLVNTVNALAADVIVITGDLVDGLVSQLGDQVAPLQRLQARYGVYFVTGNHEYFYRAAEWVAALTALGLRVLQNQSAVIHHEGVSVLLVGINDPNGQPAGGAGQTAVLAHILAAAPATALRILLAHRPGDARATARQGIDVQLSGHLHGGQFFPLTFLLGWVEPFVAGLYRVRELWLYVNRGAGYWGPPNRLGARQELTLLQLIPAGLPPDRAD